jgi:hypothetical protein
MTSPLSAPAIDLRRRRLMLSLPGSLALASPLGLIGCGGGGDGGDDAQAASDARVQAMLGRLPVAQRSVAKVAVALPSGSGATLAGSQLVTANNVAEVAADGTSGAVLVEGGAQMAYLFDAAGRLLLMGLVDPGASERIDSTTTAEALLLLTSQVSLLGEAPAMALRRTLRGHAVIAPVQAAVEGALARNGIDAGDTALMGALDGALRALFPRTAAPASARKQARGITVTPTEMQSGITVLSRSEELNTVQFANHYRRRAHVWVTRTAHVDASGNRVALTPPVAVKDFALSATTPLSFDNFVAAVGDFLAELAESIGALDPYDSGNAPWQPVLGDPLMLPLEPADARKAEYRARAVGLGAHDGGTLSAAETTKLDELWGATLYYDIVVPLVKTLILPLIGEGASSTSISAIERFGTNVLLSGALDLTSIEVANQTLPGTVAALKAGDAQGLITTFFSEFFSSNTFQTLLAELFTALAEASDPRGPRFASTDLRDSQGRLIGVNLLNDKALIRRNMDQLQRAATKLARIIAVAKAVATAADYAAMAKDWLASAKLAEFDLEATSARLKLTPNAAEADPLAGAAGKAAITATLEGLGAGLSSNDVFLKWSCTKRYGSLYQRGGSGIDDFESTLASPVHDYIPSGVEDDPALPDVVSVEAWYRNPTSAQQTRIAVATTTIRLKKMFTLSISPSGPTSVPTDTTLPMSAFLNETLPAGATVEWTWSVAGPASLAAAQSSSGGKASSAPLTTGASDGRATVTAKARVSVPATATTQAIVITTNPVDAILDVKKGQRTINFRAPGGVFACGPTCGVTDYTAFIVPRMAKATNYTAVFSEFGYGPCNRTVSWTTEKGDGGGCNFPISYHPFSAREAATAWAVWIGFGGPLTGPGHCDVTITLAP